MTRDGIDVRVAEKRAIAEDIAMLVLQSVRGESLPPFEAGAHIDVHLPNGLVRQYSLCGTPARVDRYELGVLLDRNGRGGSRALHEEVQPGDVLRISRPRNLFNLVPGRHSILVAGGIGITPLLAMAEHLGAVAASFELHHCARSLKRTAFVERLADAPYRDRVFHHFDNDPATRLDTARLLASPEAQTHLYVCGPEGFMRHVIAAAREAGWAESNIHSERFAAAPQDRGTSYPFEVQLGFGGKVIPVRADESVFAALAAHGIDIPISCEQGICGTCVMRVLEGVPDHRDTYLSEEERVANDRFTPCCSRALTNRLVIQL